MKHHKSLSHVSVLLLEFALPSYLKRVTSIRFSVNHLHDIFMYQFSRLISISPVIGSSHAILSNEEVLWIVDILVWTSLNTIENLREVSTENLGTLSYLPKQMCTLYRNVPEAPNRSRWLLGYISYRPTGRKIHLSGLLPRLRNPPNSHPG